VATINRLLKIIGLYCRIKSLLYGSFAKETYNCKEPTDRRHPICTLVELDNHRIAKTVICTRLTNKLVMDVWYNPCVDKFENKTVYI